MSDAPRPWKPTTIIRPIKSLDSGAGVVVVETDAGEAYLKAMGNPGGEHCLACEWVGTQLARWFDLPTFDFSLIDLDERNSQLIAFAAGGYARPGPAFITRAEAGSASGAARRISSVA